MQKYLLLLFSFTLSISTLLAQQGEWTWMNGSNFPNQPANWGTQGVPHVNNTPIALYEPCEWTDNMGNFWLFGGVDSMVQEYAALWRYNPVTYEWTWIKGPSTTEYPGVYGTQGISGPNNNPGSRAWGVTTWTDLSGTLWLFGGFGDDENGNIGFLNDLWKYDISTNEWTWMRGSKFINSPGSYGVKGVSDPLNDPPNRAETSCGWTDDNNNLWLFGGGTDYVEYNDLWRYNIALNEWTWMKGSSFTNSPAVYGIKGVADTSNTPGARQAYAHWKDLDGNLWFFGGGEDGIVYNDMWKYDIAANAYTWVSGTALDNPPGVYGTKCVADSANIPEGRFETRACWTDSCGNFYFYNGFDQNQYYIFADLWMYSPPLNVWSWIGGDNTVNVIPVNGTKGISNVNNAPGARSGAVAWKDLQGNLWLFGGFGYTASAKRRNDLWRYVLDPSCGSGISCLLAPTSYFSVNNTKVCKKFCLSFSDQSSSSPTSWQWTFEGANPSSSTDQNPASICYDNTGIFDVTLITTNANSSDTLILIDYITVYETPPFPTITQNGNTLTSSTATSYQWQLNSIDIAGATNQIYEAAQSGLYSVIITDINGCTNSIEQYITITAITEAENLAHISIYPNPSSGSFTVEFLNLQTSEEVTIEVIDVLGRKIFLNHYNIVSDGWKIEIDLSKTARGFYFMEVKTIDNLLRKKIVISR